MEKCSVNLSAAITFGKFFTIILEDIIQDDSTCSSFNPTQARRAFEASSPSPLSSYSERGAGLNGAGLNGPEARSRGGARMNDLLILSILLIVLAWILNKQSEHDGPPLFNDGMIKGGGVYIA